MAKTERKGSNKFDFNKRAENRFDFTKDEADEVEVIEKGKHSTDTEEPKGKFNKTLLYGIVAVVVAVIIAGCCYFFSSSSSNEDNPLVSQSDSLQSQGQSEIAEVSDKNTQEENAGNEESKEYCQTSITPEDPISESNNGVQTVPSAQKQEMKNNTPVSTKIETNQTSTSVSVPSAQVSDNLEENARQVVRGVFGNGQERKNKLGSAYSEIQKRVNEMYKQGLVD